MQFFGGKQSGIREITKILIAYVLIWQSWQSCLSSSIAFKFLPHSAWGPDYLNVEGGGIVSKTPIVDSS